MKSHTQLFIRHLPVEYENHAVEIKRKDGTLLSFTQKKILLHMITHEVHHVGQLSIWSRELGLKPISSDLIARDFY